MVFFMVQSFRLWPDPKRPAFVDLPQVRQSRALSRQKAMRGITTFMSKAAIDVKGRKVRKVRTADIDRVFHVPIWMQVQRKSAQSPDLPMLQGRNS
jgi:hypothetical protein